MKLLVAIALLASTLSAQPSSISITGPAPDPVQNAGGRAVGLRGNATLYYWVIARYPTGTSAPAPVAVPSTLGSISLSVANYVEVNWSAAAGATGYDVLRSSNDQFPALPCASCAVITSTALTTIQDTGAALTAYPTGGVAPASTVIADLTVNNKSAPQPFLQVEINGQAKRIPTAPTAPPVAGNCVAWAANGSQADAGNPCGTGGPGGAAGGDLSGTYPNPSVTTVGGTAAAAIAAQLPSATEKAALAGTTGTPGAANRFVTDTDPRLSGSSSYCVLTDIGTNATMSANCPVRAPRKAPVTPAGLVTFAPTAGTGTAWFGWDGPTGTFRVWHNVNATCTNAVCVPSTSAPPPTSIVFGTANVVAGVVTSVIQWDGVPFQGHVDGPVITYLEDVNGNLQPQATLSGGSDPIDNDADGRGVWMPFGETAGSGSSIAFSGNGTEVKVYQVFVPSKISSKLPVVRVDTPSAATGYRIGVLNAARSAFVCKSSAVSTASGGNRFGTWESGSGVSSGVCTLPSGVYWMVFGSDAYAVKFSHGPGNALSGLFNEGGPANRRCGYIASGGTGTSTSYDFVLGNLSGSIADGTVGADNCTYNGTPRFAAWR